MIATVFTLILDVTAGLSPDHVIWGGGGMAGGAGIGAVKSAFAQKATDKKVAEINDRLEKHLAKHERTDLDLATVLSEIKTELRYINKKLEEV